ncbi:hypothetical protein BN128_4707 [Cronobacter sakazakii 696]|nr:hypothetical protein BN128_4707 [Cronobacter sakazakii 696]
MYCLALNKLINLYARTQLKKGLQMGMLKSAVFSDCKQYRYEVVY